MAKMASRSDKAKDSKSRSYTGLLKTMKWFAILLAGSGLVVTVIFAGIWLFSLNTDNVFPINRIELNGQKFTDVQELHSVLKSIDDRGFFTMDMQQAVTKVEALAWVKNVQLRKVWPETLQINIKEHQPFAYWGNNGVVSQEGEVFYPANLPQQTWAKLSGPDALAKDLTELLQMYQQQLQQKHLRIEKMQLSERGAINLRLQNGVDVHLGKVHVEQRLERLIQYFDVLVAQKTSPLAYVDMRYENGLSAKWHDSATVQ